MNKTKLIALMLMSTTLLSGCGNNKSEEVDDLTPRINMKMAANEDGSYTINATVYPELTTNKQINWLIDWDTNEASSTDDDEWKVGKSITDYLKLTIGEDTHSVNLKLEAPFASQAKVIASMAVKPEIRSNIVVNYAKRDLLKKDSRKKFLLSTNDEVPTDLTCPYYVGETIGSVPRIGTRNVEYFYGDNFVWYGGAQTTPVAWTERISVSSNGITTNDLLGTLILRFQSYKTRTISKEVFRIFEGTQADNFFATKKFANEIVTNPTGEVYRNRGAKLCLPYRIYVDGKLFGTQDWWFHADFDTTNVAILPTSLVLDSNEIVF